MSRRLLLRCTAVICYTPPGPWVWGYCHETTRVHHARRRVAAGWPLAARAQQRERMRRIGVLVGGLAADDPVWQARSNAFVQGLQDRGWSDGRNMRVEYRWGLGDPDR